MFKNSLTYSIEKVILTWQFIVLLLIFLLLPSLQKILKNTDKIGVGDFHLTVKELAKNSGISSNDIRDLDGLTYNELKIFLIKGGEDANYYEFEDNSANREIFIRSFKHLDKKGLIQIKKFDSTKHADGYYEYYFFTNSTEKGEKIHRAILDAIYGTLLNARIKDS